MLFLEELVDAILIEEGQTLMGLSFIFDSLKLDLSKLDVIFRKTCKEYGMRKPLQITDIFYGNPIQMPEGTLGARVARYGVLPEIPRFYMPTFGDISVEYIPETNQVKVWPPIVPIKLTYTKLHTIQRNKRIDTQVISPQDEDLIFSEVKGTPRENSIRITKGDLEMVETCRGTLTPLDGDNAEADVIIDLAGTLGTGTINLSTRELQLELTDVSQGVINIGYIPTYSVILELGMKDYVFNKFFASRLLMALASLRAQATQQEIHNIDLTADDLMSRARLLQKEVTELLKSTINFSAMSPE